jgi:DNA polymerase-3 subunit gamma/tau
MAGDEPGTAPENPPSSPPAPAALALYRRYRPATFAEVRGQEHVTEPLRQALRNGRVNHAYLFSGPRGCGKTSSARILARSLNCVQGPTPDPCGVCDSCVALAPSGPGSIDVIEIDAASHGGVDDARDLRERAFYAPVSGRFKIYIIDEAHMVTSGGFNALLKLVEEPPPHLKFVFATTEPEKVIPTIKSRTHHYPFRLVPPTVLRGLLEEILAAESVSYEPTVLPLVVRAGAGSVRDSLSVLDQLLAGAGPEGLTYERTVALLGYTDDSLLDEMVDAMAAGDGAAVFGTVDRVVQGGHDPRRYAADLLDRLRDLIILGAVPGAGQTGLLDAPADRLEKMSDQAGRFGQAELARAAEILSDGLIQMRGTTSPRLLLELMCAQVLLPGASTGEKAFAARLERIERRLDGLGSEETPAGPAAPGTRSSAAAAPPAERPPAAPVTARAAAAGAGTAQEAAPAPEAAPVRETPRAREAVAARETRAAPQGPDAPEVSAGQEAAATGAAGRGTAHAQVAPARQTAGRDAGAQQAEGQDAGGREAAAREAPARTAPPARPGVIDIDTLRQRWPDVLDAVKSERRVAWMLLDTASVDSLEGGVLTVAFAKEGQAKGFAASGHDQVLTGVLADMLGLNVRVRAAVGTVSGAHGARPAQTDPAPRAGATRPGTAGSGTAGSGAAGSGTAGSGAAGSGAGRPGTAGSGAAGSGAGRPGVTRPGGAGPGDATDPQRGIADRPDGLAGKPGAPGGMPGNAGTPPGEFHAPPGQGGPSGMTGAGGAAAGRASSSPRPPEPRPGAATSAPPPVDLEEEWPDDAGPADGGAGPTGMELIERQLGGTIIEEIDEP